MFAFAYLLFTNVAIMVGMLVALVAQSRRGDDELAAPSLDRHHRLPPASFSRTRRMSQISPPR